MSRRIVAALLWVWAIATAWAFLAWGAGVPSELGPFVALAVGAFVGMDPLHRIWTKPTPIRSAKLTTLETDAV
jgi:hypothetical protein